MRHVPQDAENVLVGHDSRNAGRRPDYSKVVQSEYQASKDLSTSAEKLASALLADAYFGDECYWNEEWWEMRVQRASRIESPDEQDVQNQAHGQMCREYSVP